MLLWGKSGCDRHQRAYEARSIYHLVLCRTLCRPLPGIFAGSALSPPLCLHVFIPLSSRCVLCFILLGLILPHHARLHKALWISAHLLYSLMPLEVSHTEGRNLDS